MRGYETISIFRPGLGDEAINTIVDNTAKIITGVQGTVIDFTRWGMKKLAYPIKKETQGLYFYYEYAATPAAVAEIERKFRIDDAVLKYLTIKVADSISAEQIQQAIADSKSRNAAFLQESSDQSPAAAEEGEEAEVQTED